MDTKKFRVMVTKEWHAAAGRGLYAVTMFAVRQPGCTNASIKECTRDKHPYCSNQPNYQWALDTAGYYGWMLQRDEAFGRTITNQPPKKRKRNHSWK